MALILAYRNTMHDFSKTALSIMGIMAAIVLVFMQLGFRGAVITTSTSVFQQIDFDIVLRSKDYLQLVDPGRIDQKWMNISRSLPEVSSVSTLDISIGQFRRKSDGTQRAMMVLGVDPAHSPFLAASKTTQIKRILTQRSLLIDTKTHHSFQPADGSSFGKEDIGSVHQMNQKEVTIDGTFTLGTGLAVNGSVMTNKDGFFRLFPHFSTDSTSLIFLKLRSSGDKTKIVERLKQLVTNSDRSESIDVNTREELIGSETSRWLYRTPIGLIFSLGVIVSSAIGSVIVYMILVSDVRKRIAEYATLAAIGYSNTFLAAVVLWQAVLLASLAFIPSLVVSEVLYRLTAFLAGVPLEMNIQRISFVFGLSVVMSVVSGMLAVSKLWKAQPANLF